eukprot:608154-Ditylum_brightwellii.AAC.1
MGHLTSILLHEPHPARQSWSMKSSNSASHMTSMELKGGMLGQHLTTIGATKYTWTKQGMIE